MYKLRFFSSFGPSLECKNILERLCETHLLNEYGKDKKIFITNGDDYTHVVILNIAMPVIPSHIPKKNVTLKTSSTACRAVIWLTVYRSSSCRHE